MYVIDRKERNITQHQVTALSQPNRSTHRIAGLLTRRLPVHWCEHSDSPWTKKVGSYSVSQQTLVIAEVLFPLVVVWLLRYFRTGKNLVDRSGSPEQMMDSLETTCVCACLMSGIIIFLSMWTWYCSYFMTRVQRYRFDVVTSFVILVTSWTMGWTVFSGAIANIYDRSCRLP